MGVFAFSRVTLMRPVILAVFAACASVLPAQAHEFWVEPDAYTVSSGESVVAHFRNGEHFNGNRLALIPGRYTRLDFVVGETLVAITGDVGQRPAVDLQSAETGLGILAVVSTTSRLRYKQWAKFQKFIDHKAFPLTKAEHLALGFPESDFRERYRRYAKSLVGIGDAAGRDRRLGLDIELVALANPYTDDLSDGFAVQAYLGDAVSADVQIELFEKNAAGEVNITLHRTDGDGVAVLPVRPGHRYLVDTVHLRPAPADTEADVVWDTLWASLTFAVPE